MTNPPLQGLRELLLIATWYEVDPAWGNVSLGQGWCAAFVGRVLCAGQVEGGDAPMFGIRQLGACCYSCCCRWMRGTLLRELHTLPCHTMRQGEWNVLDLAPLGHLTPCLESLAIRASKAASDAEVELVLRGGDTLPPTLRALTATHLGHGSETFLGLDLPGCTAGAHPPAAARVLAGWHQSNAGGAANAGGAGAGGDEARERWQLLL